MKVAVPRQIRLLAIFLGIVAILVCSAFLLNKEFNGVTEQESWVLHTEEVLTELESTISAAKDAETGIRGFLLTDTQDYLDPYHQGVSQAFEHLRRVKFLTEDNPTQQSNVAVLDDTLKRRFAALETLLELYHKNKAQFSKGDLRFGEGKMIMDSLRAQIDKMKSSEEQLLKLRRETTEHSRDIFFWILCISTGIMVTIIGAAFIQIGVNQARAYEEALLKSKEAEEKDLVAELSRTIAGDISFENAGKAILQFLSLHLGVLAGRIWILEGRDKLAPVASLAVNEDTSKTAEATPQSSLVEAASRRDDIWKVTDVPSDYWKVVSGLGSALPNELTFVPFSFQDRRLGVIELGSFSAIGDRSLQFLRILHDTIGVGLNAALSRSRLQTLLEKTQLQSEELHSQQEELKTNNEELEQQARALESQQQALNEKNTELENRAQELQRSSQYKSEFLAKMSHELRTPLNGLLILSTLLIENKEKNLTEQQRQFARSINNAGNDLLVLISDILDLSKIEARKLTLRPEEFTIGEIFEQTKRLFEPQTDAKHLDLKLDLPAEMRSVKIFTDRQRLEQILRNFLSNAVKFTEKGSVSLEVELNKPSGLLTLKVSDTGIGIPKGKQDAIFEAFMQADSSVSRKYGGTGLGLTISKELATLLGGHITVNSEEGKGSQFSVQIPLHAPMINAETTAASPSFYGLQNEEKAVHHAANHNGGFQSSSDRVLSTVAKALKGLPKDKKSILIVEDDAAFRSSVVEAVKGYGFAPIEAGDGEVALAIAKEHPPDAILLDIKLPGISGLGILEVIKQIPNLRHIPVHMISALDYQNSALRMGALGYLTKPVTIEKIRSALGRIENMISKKLRSVLIIEDDERQNEAISQLISGSDLEVVSVKTGKDALAKVKTQGFDCIILDLTLPDVSGIDLLSELRGLEISLPPVVIYTGKDLSDDEERYLRKYSESIVIKGARSPERLLDEVNLFLHRVESLLPDSKREMLSHMRSQEKSFEGKTVLIADDDIRNVFALTSALESRGLQTRVARDGVEALEMLQKHDEIDLVLMDIMMPRMDGFEAMKQIRKNTNLHIRNIPIVALTAKAMKDDHEKCIEAGANDYLPKPVNLENLSTILKVWLVPKGFLA
jgi:CheY-like chemotaxis protein/CHASE3 domain sensor protein